MHTDFLPLRQQWFPFQMNPVHNFALSPVTASHSDSEEEDSFLQMTMGDIGNATVEVDSFCRLGREAEASTNTERNRDGLNQGGRDFSRSSLSGKQHLTRHPLER